MAEAVPLGATLERHHDQIIGTANAAAVEGSGPGIRARAGHHMDRVEPAHGRIRRLGALRTELIIVQAHGHDLALFDQPGGTHNVFLRGVVECSDFIVRTPFAPVLVPFGVVREDLVGYAQIAIGIGHFICSFLTRLGLL